MPQPPRKEQIARIQAQARPELDQLRADGQALHEQAAKLWTASTLDERAIEQSRQKWLHIMNWSVNALTRFMLDVARF